jgi:hypothetical protein
MAKGDNRVSKKSGAGNMSTTRATVRPKLGPMAWLPKRRLPRMKIVRTAVPDAVENRASFGSILLANMLARQRVIDTFHETGKYETGDEESDSEE